MPLHSAKYINKDSRSGIKKNQSRLIKMELHSDGKLTVSLVHASPSLVFMYGSENDFNQDWKIENTEGSSPDEKESIGPDSKEDAN